MFLRAEMFTLAKYCCHSVWYRWLSFSVVIVAQPFLLYFLTKIYLHFCNLFKVI